MPLIFTYLADMLAAFAVPLAMFFIGAVVSDFQRGDVKISYFEVTTPIFIKLILLPFIVIFFLYDTNLSRVVTDIVIIQSMIPALTLSSVLFANYSRDDKLGAFLTILSRFASLLVIPLILYFINHILI